MDDKDVSNENESEEANESHVGEKGQIDTNQALLIDSIENPGLLNKSELEQESTGSTNAFLDRDISENNALDKSDKDECLSTNPSENIKEPVIFQSDISIVTKLECTGTNRRFEDDYEPPIEDRPETEGQEGDKVDNNQPLVNEDTSQTDDRQIEETKGLLASCAGSLQGSEHDNTRATESLDDTKCQTNVSLGAEGFGQALADSDDKDSSKEQREVQNSPRNASIFDPSHSVYYLKKFKWKGEAIQIVTQNENGPCPLLAIANVLVLSKRIVLPLMQECITATQLMEYIGDYILAVGPNKNVEEAVLLNYQQNMHDAISIMYKLQTGIDVNVKFSGPHDFELTPECLVFDILNIGLYHGWIVDPQDSQMVNAVGNLSYNQLVEKIIQSKEENADEQKVTEGFAAENFLEQTASQLTYHGLCELNSATKEEELCVFFRNNHFSTLFKHKDELFLLVTDQGYLNQSKIIWETLANVDGDGQFVDENFVTVGPMTYQPTFTERTPQTQNELTQEDRDYLIALSLQEEARTPGVGESQVQEPVPVTAQQQEANDLELARRLQEEENRIARQNQQQHQNQQQQQLQQQQLQQNQQQQHQQQFQPHHQPPAQPQQQQSRAVSGSGGEKCVLL